MATTETPQPFTTTRAGRTWHYHGVIGNDSVMIGLRYPSAVAIAPDGAVFILSRGMPSVGKEDSNEGCKIGKWTLDGYRTGDYARVDFTWPAGLAVSSDGTVFASDEHDNLVSTYSPDGPFRPFPEFDPDGEYASRWGVSGSEPGQIDGPSGLAFDVNDDLYVADGRNNRVQKFTRDGRYLAGWGTRGPGPGEFDRPWGITVDAEGHVYVADWGNNRVQKFGPEGEFILSFGTDRDAGGDLEHPSDVAVDSQGDVYVADWGNKRVQIYEADGEIIGALHGSANNPYSMMVQDMFQLTDVSRKADARIERGSLMSRFDRPVGLAVDADDRLYVVESRRCRVQVYTKDLDYVDAPADA